MRVELRPLALLLALVFGPSLPAASVQPVWLSFPDYNGTAQGGFPCQLAGDGKTIVTAMEGGQISFRSAPTFLVTRVLKVTNSPVRAIAISPDASLVAVGGACGELVVVQTQTGFVKQIRPSVTNRNTYPYGPWPAVLKFSGSSDKLFALYNSGSLWIGDPKTGATHISRFIGFQVKGADVTRSLDNFAVTDGNRQVSVFETESGILLNHWSIDADGSGVPLFRPDASRVGVLGGYWFKEYDWKSGTLTRQVAAGVGLNGAYSRDGQNLISLGYHPTKYDLNTGSVQVLSWRELALTAFNTLTDRLFVSYDWGSFDYFGNSSQELISILDNTVVSASRAEGSTRTLAFTPDGRFIVQASVGTEPILRKTTGEFVAALPLDFDVRYQSRPAVAVSPDGVFVAVTTRTSISVCSLIDGTFLRRSDPNSIYGPLGFTRDSTRLLYLKGGQLRALVRTTSWQDVLVHPGPFSDLQTSKAPWAIIQGGNSISLVNTSDGTVAPLLTDVGSAWCRLSLNGQFLYVGKDNLVEVYALPLMTKQRVVLLPSQEAAGSLAPQAMEGDFLLQTWNVWSQTVQTYRFHSGWLEQISRVSSPAGDVPTLVASPVDNRFAFAGSGALSGVSEIRE